MNEFALLFFLGLLIHTAALGSKHPGIDADFENGTIEPWNDCSEVGTHWMIENNPSWTSEMRTSQQLPPPPVNGKYFLLLKHELNTFGIGVLASPTFTAYPGDKVAFSYWFHPSYRHFSNIEVYVLSCQMVNLKKKLDVMTCMSSADDCFMNFNVLSL